MDITEYLHRLEYIKGHQEASGNPQEFNRWRSEQWRLERSYSDAEDRQRISFNRSLNERFDQFRSSVSHIQQRESELSFQLSEHYNPIINTLFKNKDSNGLEKLLDEIPESLVKMSVYQALRELKNLN